MSHAFPGWGQRGRDPAVDDMPEGIQLTRGGLPISGPAQTQRIPPPSGASGPGMGMGAPVYNAFPGHSGAHTAPTYPMNLPGGQGQGQQWTYGQYAPSPHHHSASFTPMTTTANPWQVPNPPKNENVSNGFSSTAWRQPERQPEDGRWFGSGGLRGGRDPMAKWKHSRRRQEENNGWGDSGGGWDDGGWGGGGGGGWDDGGGWGESGGGGGRSGWDREEDNPWSRFGTNDAHRGRRERRDTWAGRDTRDTLGGWGHHQQPRGHGHGHGHGWGDEQEYDENEDEGEEGFGSWEDVGDRGRQNHNGGGGGGWFNNAERSRSRGPPNKAPALGGGGWETDMDSIPQLGGGMGMGMGGGMGGGAHHQARDSFRPGGFFHDDDDDDEAHARRVEERMRPNTPHIPGPQRDGHRHRSKSRTRDIGNGTGNGGGWDALDSWGEQRPEDQAHVIQLARLRERDRDEKRQREEREMRRQQENLGWGGADEDGGWGGGDHSEGSWELMDKLNSLSLNGRGHHIPHQSLHKKHKKRARSLSAHRNPLHDGYHVSYEQYKDRNGVHGPREEDLPYRPSTWREGYSVRSGGGGLGKNWFAGTRRSDVKEINDPVKRSLHPHLQFMSSPSASLGFSPYSPHSGQMTTPPISLDLRISPSLPHTLRPFLPQIQFLTLPRNPSPIPNQVDLMQYATDPPAPQMRLFHRRLPWYVDVMAGMGGRQGGGSFVTVWDVIVGLYHGLTGGEGWGVESQVRPEEYWAGEMGDHVDATPPPPSAGNLPGSTPNMGMGMNMGRKMKRTAREQVSMSWRLRGQLANQVRYAQVMMESRMEDIARAEGAKAEQADLQKGVRRVDFLSVGAYVGTGGEGSDARAYRWIGLKKAKRGMWEIVTEI